eukprot:116579_1
MKRQSPSTTNTPTLKRRKLNDSEFNRKHNEVHETITLLLQTISCVLIKYVGTHTMNNIIKSNILHKNEWKHILPNNIRLKQYLLKNDIDQRLQLFQQTHKCDRQLFETITIIIQIDDFNKHQNIINNALTKNKPTDFDREQQADKFKIITENKNLYPIWYTFDPNDENMIKMILLYFEGDEWYQNDEDENDDEWENEDEITYLFKLYDINYLICSKLIQQDLDNYETNEIESYSINCINELKTRFRFGRG